MKNSSILVWAEIPGFCTSKSFPLPEWKAQSRAGGDKSLALPSTSMTPGLAWLRREGHPFPWGLVPLIMVLHTSEAWSGKWGRKKRVQAGCRETVPPMDSLFSPTAYA